MRFIGTLLSSGNLAPSAVRPFGWRALLRRAATTVLSKVRDQPVHGLVAGRIDHRTALAPYGHESCLPQAIEVESECVRCKLEGAGDAARRHACGPRLYEQAIHVQTSVLGERGQGRHGIRLFHTSTIIESWPGSQDFAHTRP